MRGTANPEADTTVPSRRCRACAPRSVTSFPVLSPRRAERLIICASTEHLNWKMTTTATEVKREMASAEPRAKSTTLSRKLRRFTPISGTTRRLRRHILRAGFWHRSTTTGAKTMAVVTNRRRRSIFAICGSCVVVLRQVRARVVWGHVMSSRRLRG